MPPGVFVPGLFPEETLAGEEVSKTEIGNVAMYNKLVGAIRFRQVRRRRSRRPAAMHACMHACSVCVCTCGSRQGWPSREMFREAPGCMQQCMHGCTDCREAPTGGASAPRCISPTLGLCQVRTMPNVGCSLAKMNRRTMVRPNGSLYDEDFVAACYVKLSKQLGNEQTGAFGPGVLPARGDGTPGSCADVLGADGKPLQPVGPHGIYDPAQHAPRLLCEAFTFQSEDQTLEARVTLEPTPPRPSRTPPLAPGPDPAPSQVPVEAVGLPANLYPGGGYVRDVVNPINCEEEEGVEPVGMCKRGGQVREDLLLAIEQLKSNRWVDANTRAVIIKVAFYNGNTNSFVTAGATPPHPPSHTLTHTHSHTTLHP